jgi:P-type Ca2+ transporter type 2C
MLTIRDVLQTLPTTLDQGLHPSATADSVQRFGVNRLTALPREPVWRKFLDKFDEPIIKILLAAALLSMGVEFYQAVPLLGAILVAATAALVAAAWIAGLKHWVPSILFAAALGLFIAGLAVGHLLVEGMAVMVAVILATGVAFASEYRSDREFEAINQNKEMQRAKVLRGGNHQVVGLEDVVVGDIVILEAGDEIPADGRIVSATDLAIDQALMTGESEPTAKSACQDTDAGDGPDHAGCVYRGTQVVDGVGRMLVIEVGDATAVGQIARRLASGADDQEQSDQNQRVQRKLTISKQLTPLQRKLERLANVISRVGYAAALLIFVVQVAHGIVQGKLVLPTDAASATTALGVLLGYFVNMVIIIVVAVPEGLPMSVTVSLALAMRKMTRANALVRQLVACETIGSATVICTDKTGTLTQNRMQVVRVVCGGQVLERGSPDWPKSSAVAPAQSLALNAALNSTANLEEKGGSLQAVGNTTEAALLHWLHEAGVDYRGLRGKWPVEQQMHFSSDRKRMTTVLRRGGEREVLVKGSPEWLLTHSTHYQEPDGSTHAWTPAARQAMEANLQGAAASAMRTLAFGHKALPGADGGAPELEDGLVFDGFVAIQDPVRTDVVGAVAQCRRAGIGIKMVTGDNVATARAIAFQVGLIEQPGAAIDVPGAAVMTGAHFEALDDERLKAELGGLRVLARARPLDKYRLVRLLQEQGEVVAVTGDGTNDAPALKKADVGLAMGITGTEVAKEASKIVLLDDSFATIVRSVHWGRALYENIQRFLQFQLTINVSALLIYLLGLLLFSVEAPFTVLQLLWINVIMDTFASIALCSEPPRLELMDLPPKKRDEPIVTRSMAVTIFSTAFFFVVVLLALLAAMKGTPSRPGWLGDRESAWSVEVGPSRLAAAAGDLEKRVDATAWVENWHIRETPSNPALTAVAGRRVEVSFTVYQVSLFFSLYVFFQVWNQVNCRSLSVDSGGFRGIGGNPTFLAIAAAVAIGQIIIVSFGGAAFKVEPLDAGTWIGIICASAIVLVFAECVRRARRFLSKARA